MTRTDDADDVMPHRPFARITSAFKCLPGHEPVELHENNGCRWPIHLRSPIDCLVEPLTTLQCGAPCVYEGEVKLRYCHDHKRIGARHPSQKPVKFVPGRIKRLK